MSGIRLLPIIMVLAISVSCSDGSPVSPSNVPLEGTMWRLETFDLDSGPVPAAKDQELTLRLLGETDNGYIALADADCNDCGGEYSIWAEDSIRLWLACTEAACPPGSQGGMFSTALSHTTVFDHCDGVLRISFVDDSFQGELEFRADTYIVELDGV